MTLISRRSCYAIVLVSALTIAGCSAHAENPVAGLPLVKGKMVRILALGDSITRGSGDGFGNYRRPLQALLAQGGYQFEFVGSNTEQSDNYHGSDPEQTFTPYQRGHEGYGGFRIEQIGSENKDKDDGGVAYPGLSAALEGAKPDVVLMMLGTNDVNQGFDTAGATGYNGQIGFAADAAARMDALVTRIHELKPDAALVLATITPLRDAGKQAKGKDYNALIQQVVAAHQKSGENIVFADMGTALQTNDLAGDGVHPTTRGYDKMARVWFAALTNEKAPPLAPEKVVGQGQIAQKNKFSTAKVTAGDSFGPAFVAGNLCDGTSKAFVWKDGGNERVSLTGFQGPIERLRFFDTPSYTGRTPRKVTVYAADKEQNSLEMRDYTKIGEFVIPGAGDKFETATNPPVFPDQGEPAAHPDAVVNFSEVAVKIPATAQSLLLDFSKAGGEGDGLSEIEALPASPK